MAVNGVEIKVGQTWRQRGGVTVDITEKCSGTRYVWLSSSGESYDDDGQVWSDEISDEDLVELISPGAKTVDGIRIEVGQTWQTRDESEVTIVAHEAGLIYPWRSESESYTDEGFCYIGHRGAGDLIDLITRPETVPFSSVDAHSAANDSVFKKLAPGLTTNPKDAIGSTKLPLHLWPAEATALGCLGMLEGMLKYGRSNFIAGDGVVASIYVAAAKRHIDAWFSGEECAPDTGNEHLANGLACLAIIVKARAHGKLIDDRDFAPNAGYRKLVEELTPNVKRLQELFADKSPRHFTIGDNK